MFSFIALRLCKVQWSRLEDFHRKDGLHFGEEHHQSFPSFEA